MGTAERKEREKARRRDQIINAAKKVFLERGFRGATMEAIAEECELSIGTLYLYFKNKDDLYSALNAGPLSFLDREMSAIVGDETLPVEDKLRRAWAALHRNFLSDPTATLAVLHIQLEDSLSILSPERLAELNQLSRSFMGKIASIFQEGMDQGLFAPANPYALADLFWGTFSGVVLWEVAKTRMDPAKDFLAPTLDLGLELILRGIRRPLEARR